jgi:hypothetical protein
MIVLILSSLIYNSYCDDINYYEQIKIRSIEIGKDNGKIGLNFKPVGPQSPYTFSIGKNNWIYVPDAVNYRINVYDLNLNYISEIVVTDKQYNWIYNAYKINIDMNQDLIIFYPDKGLIKINKAGNFIFEIDKGILPVSVIGSKEFFLIDNYILYYDDSKENKITFINPSGNILTLNETTKFVKELEEKGTKKFVSNSPWDKVKEIIEKEKVIVNDDKLLTTVFMEHRKFYHELSGNKYISRNGDEQKIYDKIDIDLSKFKNFIFIGFDSENNSYWRVKLPGKYKHVIIICSTYGAILDCFDTNLKIEYVYTAISPAGDIYFMDFNKEGTHFYKIERRW